MNNLLELRGVCKDYGAFLLSDITLDLPGGTVMGLIGENGAGKSTIFRCILGLTPLSGGSVRVLGEDPRTSPVLEDVGIALDECFFHDGLTPAEVGRVLARVYRRWDAAFFARLLEKYEIPPRQMVKTFSRGMKMKLSIASALAHCPRLLLLDEATGGLDPVVRDALLDDFLAFAGDEDHAVLLSSHITSDLEKAADYVAYLHRGRLVLQGAREDLLETYGRLVCTEADFARVNPAFVAGVRRGAYSTEALIRPRDEFARRFPDLHVERVTLEDIMLFTGKEAAPEC